jgi:pyruvate formate lyase activating enzyme
MTSAPVNKIIPFSMVDGPGSRTSVFLQGCNIDCAYCHNPETQQLCCNCETCVTGCPAKALSVRNNRVVWNGQKCVSCDQCIKICLYHASPRVLILDAPEVFRRVQKNIPFIRGITVSGGECMLYPDFLLELFTRVKKVGLTALIDTNVTVDFRLYPQLTHMCDGVMLDVKSWAPQVFRTLTGTGNEVVKENLRYLADENRLEEIRIVCLDDWVDAEAVIYGVAKTLGEKNALQNLRLIRFRPFGVRGALENTPPPSEAKMQELQELAKKCGFQKIRITSLNWTPKKDIAKDFLLSKRAVTQVNRMRVLWT